MAAVFTGFLSLAVIVLLGYLLARWHVLGPGAAEGLSKLTFFVGTPALMFLTLARADVAAVFSESALVNWITAVVLAAVYALVARFVLRRRGAEVTLGALSASYVNAGNMGIPILVFAAGSAAAIAPVLLFQLLVMVPVSFTILDLQTGRRGVSRVATLTSPLRNPLVVGVALGLVFSLTGWQLPAPVLLPVQMIADIAVPIMLLSFGLSLRGAPPPGRGEGRGTLWFAVVLKNLAGPGLAFVLGRYAFDLTGTALLAPVVVAALPTAQNVFVYAMRYGQAVAASRETILLTTVACVPVVVALTGLLG
ncbi:AEC family transporter [Georgenia sp. SYP-B2076]|uniref:AEC family transporter n=1 Tax=Georgenia sp. SYP-B2076 TaxID=2495881 RepID=UPI000F8D4A32|nr:AEC family transporter [Georgenia sp. SYP-B2076]